MFVLNQQLDRLAFYMRYGDFVHSLAFTLLHGRYLLLCALAHGSKFFFLESERARDFFSADQIWQLACSS